MGHDFGVYPKRKSVNKFADLTFDEFKAKYLTLKSDVHPRSSRREKIDPPAEVPDSFNLTAEGYVTPVKDQGACGSCWAFATTGLVEGFLFRRSNEGRLNQI